MNKEQTISMMERTMRNMQEARPTLEWWRLAAVQIYAELELINDEAAHCSCKGTKTMSLSDHTVICRECGKKVKNLFK